MPELEAFFHDLRTLRAGAGLSLAELAERAHFPEETLAAAEAGLAVPPNPVLVAYVQACGGPVWQWEDRWRGVSAAAASGFRAKVPEPAGTPQPAAPRRHRGRRAAAAAAVTLIAAGTAVALTRPAARTTASAGPRTSPSASRHGTSRPLPLPRHPAASPPRITSVLQVTGVGCPASQDNGVTLTAAGPGRPWTAAQGGWAGNGCDGASVWTMNPARKQPSPSTLTWRFGALPAVSRCTLSVYVPTQNALGQAGYAVSTGLGSSLSTVTIDQAADAGHWVVLGTFPAASSGYQIHLMPQVTELTAADPAAKGPGKPGAKPAPPGHNSAVAASAAAATCSASGKAFTR
jgi:transcriptional regulator with XRE-family HTH domain